MPDLAARAKLGKKDSEIIEIADLYMRPRVFVQGYLAYASRCISSYRLAEAIAVIGNGVIARECALLGIGEQHTPTLELGGLELQRAGDRKVIPTPCEPGI